MLLNFFIFTLQGYIIVDVNILCWCLWHLGKYLVVGSYYRRDNKKWKWISTHIFQGLEIAIKIDDLQNGSRSIIVPLWLRSLTTCKILLFEFLVDSRVILTYLSHDTINTPFQKINRAFTGAILLHYQQHEENMLFA